MVDRILKQNQDIINFIKTIYDGEIKINDRSIGIELDIYIPEKNFAIGFNSLFYHSELVGRGKDYHLNKTLKCKEKGIFLFHIFEDSWKEKKDVVFSMISSRLGVNSKIYARKCEIRDVNKEDRKVFFDTNHIQGKDNSSIAYGLYYNNELVSCMSFTTNVRDRNIKWELIRFASKKYFSIVGGFSKLLKHFLDNNEGSLISFSDNSYSDGGVYKKNGFQFDYYTPPDYSYLDKTFSKRLKKENFRKEKIAARYENIDLSKTERELTAQIGLVRIWSCGLTRWIIKR